MRKSFTTKYDYGDKVYLKTEPSKIRVVTGFLVRPHSVIYGITNEDESWHSAEELEPEKIVKVKGFSK